MREINTIGAFRAVKTDLRWYRTHQHMSKKLTSFDMLKNSLKLIYFGKITEPHRAF